MQDVLLVAAIGVGTGFFQLPFSVTWWFILIAAFALMSQLLVGVATVFALSVLLGWYGSLYQHPRLISALWSCRFGRSDTTVEATNVPLACWQVWDLMVHAAPALLMLMWHGPRVIFLDGSLMVHRGTVTIVAVLTALPLNFLWLFAVNVGLGRSLLSTRMRDTNLVYKVSGVPDHCWHWHHGSHWVASSIWLLLLSLPEDIARHVGAMPVLWVWFIVHATALPVLGIWLLMPRQTIDEAESGLVPELWHIHGRDYNLTEFVPRHPGGATAICLGRGRDCTRLFETYHVWGENHRKILAKYAIPSTGGSEADALLPLPGDGPFVADLKGMLRAHFKAAKGKAKRLSHHATYSHVALCFVFLMISFTSGYLYCSGRSALAGVLWPVFAWLFGANVSHDCSHQAFSSRPWVNDLGVLAASPLLFGPSTWTAQHIVAHHTQTNNPAVDGTGDPDLLHFYLPFKLSPMFAYKKFLRNHPADAVLQGIDKGFHFFAFVVSWFFGTFDLSFVHPICALFGITAMGPHVERLRMVTGCTTRMMLMNVVHVVVTLFCAWSIFCSWGGSLDTWSSFAWGVGCAFFPWAQSSIYFMIITQVSHQQPETQLAEDALAKTEAEHGLPQDAFLRGQVTTSTDYSISSRFWGIISAGLNAQSLHHVFPGICSCHFRDLYPAFEDICRKHSIKMSRRRNLGHALYTMCKYQFELGLSDPDRLLRNQKEH
jgi:fatty acid desaturase